MLKFVLPYDLSVRWNMYAYIWTLHCRNVWLFNSQFDLFLKIDIFPKKYNLIRECIFFTFVAFFNVSHILQTEASRVSRCLNSLLWRPKRMYIVTWHVSKNGTLWTFVEAAKMNEEIRGLRWRPDNRSPICWLQTLNIK